MKHYKIGYFFKQAFTSFKRNSAMSIASILVLSACLIIMGSFSVLSYTISYNLQQMYKLDNIIIYVTDGTEIETVTNNLDKGLSKYIESYEIITKSEALEIQKKKYADHPEIFDSLGNDNPLPDTVKIKYSGGKESLDAIKIKLKADFSDKGLIEEKVVSSYDVITEKVEGLRHSVNGIFVWLLALVIIVALLVIANTIKLSIHARANEIAVMRYIGASNWFITLPFVIESIYVAICAFIIAAPIQWYIYEFVFRKFILNVGIENVTVPEFLTVAPYLATAMLGVGILIAVLASIFSVKKYSKE